MYKLIKLKTYFEAKAFNVIMTKTQNNEVVTNIERAQIGNEVNAALVVRIHADASDSSSVNGTSMLVPANNQHTKDIYRKSKSYGDMEKLY